MLTKIFQQLLYIIYPAFMLFTDEAAILSLFGNEVDEGNDTSHQRTNYSSL